MDSLFQSKTVFTVDYLEKDEFIKAYRSISAQLKKKFVRKPNITDAVDGFDSLGRQQLDLGFTELSAACRLAAAQLEQVIGGNTTGTSSAFKPVAEFNNLYVESARTYSQSTEQSTTFTCYEAAINSTSDACLAWLTSMEAGQTALSLNDHQNAMTFFSRALKLAENTTELNISGEKLASACIHQGLYGEALKTLTVTKPNQKNLLTQLLLALNLEKCKNGESTLGNIVLNIIESNHSFQPLSLKYSLDSLKQGEEDEDSIKSIWPFLNLDQQQLLLNLLCTKCR